ncbi:hypothetical protein BDQ12DRAFT_725700 [Crucibulum laeve]|uniref:Uncharacterized protein n=1 Tax=Crucibulum laeve TaxID=68775 RepID=A0A5C3LRU9_9AGAR|nr:hypothetical protein BDQ12DRAFT_725700 [Crucibulum laeve]
MSTPPSIVLPESVTFSGKTALVTGANSGLGYAASLHLLERGVSTLVLATRSNAKGEETKARLLAEPSLTSRHVQAKIMAYELDLASEESVKSFATRVAADVPALDTVILNAAVNMLNWMPTPSGSDMVFQVNYASTALLSFLLLPLLRDSARESKFPSHLTFVSSRMYAYSPLISSPILGDASIFEKINIPKQSNMKRYHDSKLLLNMWVCELAKRIEPSEIVINCLCPGLVQTNIDSSLPFWLKPILAAWRYWSGRTADLASWGMIYAAGPAGSETHGRMLSDNELVTYTPFLGAPEGEEMSRKLWEETLEYSERLQPGSVHASRLKK